MPLDRQNELDGSKFEENKEEIVGRYDPIASSSPKFSFHESECQIID